MKGVYVLLIAILPLMAWSVLAHTFGAGGSADGDQGAPICYGYSIVGYDMVINARLGVPPDREVGLAIQPAPGAERYSTPLLKIVLEAYGWRGGPDDYAMRVMGNCLRQTASARLDDAG